MQTSFFSQIELEELHFASIGQNVLISRKASFYGAEKMHLGNNVRIDDFCILSGDITLGNNIHISAYSALYGAQGIIFKDNSGCSARTTIYSAMDDFSGDYLIGPFHSESETNVTGGPVVIEEFVQLGAHCLVFPGVTIHTGAVVGALSLVRSDIAEWTINVGIPAKAIRERSRKLLSFIEE